MITKNQFENLFIDYNDFEIPWFTFRIEPDICLFDLYWFSLSHVGIALYTNKINNKEYVKFGLYNPYYFEYIHHVFEYYSLNHVKLIKSLFNCGYVSSITNVDITLKRLNELLESITPIVNGDLSVIYNLK